MSDIFSPFVEGIFHVIFESTDVTPNPTLAGLFYNEIQGAYPEIQATPDLIFNIPLSPGRFEYIQTPITRFIAKDKCIIQVGKDNFIYNDVPPYKSRKEIKKEILRLLKIFVKLNKSTKIRYAQLRMINHFQIPIVEPIDDKLTFKIPKLPLEGVENAASINFNTESVLGNDVGVMTLQSHTPEGLNGNKIYALEFAVSNYLGNVSLDTISEWLDNGYDTCLKMFKNSVKS